MGLLIPSGACHRCGRLIADHERFVFVQGNPVHVQCPMVESWNSRRVAEALGLSWGYFRKRWRHMVEAEDFPHPFSGGLWDAGLVTAWRLARSERRLTGRRKKTARPAGSDSVIERERRTLDALRGRP